MDNEFIIDEELQDLIDTSITPEDKQKVYGIVISKLIRQQYSKDMVEAIINNYLDDSTNEKHLKEFQDLQSYRKECKIKAKELLNID